MESRLANKLGLPSSSRGMLQLLARPRALFGLAFVLRVLAIPLAVFRLTPYSQADATGFSVVAGMIANNVLSGTLSIATPYTGIYETWGSLLSPFWFLPVGGPILARIFLSLLGAYAVYNVVLITRRLGTPMAGLLAGLPLAVYPSIVLVQSSLLREAAVLFGITTAARLLLIVSDHKQDPFATDRSRRQRIALATLSVGLLAFATLLRGENLPVYVVAIGAGCVAYYSTTRWGKGLAILAVVAGGVGAWGLRDEVIQRFNFLRSARFSGRTAYLGDVRFHSLLDMAAFAPVGAAYLLFAPFPWQVGSALDVPVLFEGLANVLYAFAGIAGVAIGFKRDRVATVGLGIYFVLGVVVYGLGTANYGTGIRHRQMFTWVLFLFGGVGVHWLWLRYAPSDVRETVRGLVSI